MNSNPIFELLSLNAVKGTAVLLVALLLGLSLHRMAAARRYAIWITTIAALAVLPLAIWALPAWRVLPKTSADLSWPVFESAADLNGENPKAVSLPAGAKLSFPPQRIASFESGPAQAEALSPAQPEEGSGFLGNISWQDVVEALPLAWMLIAALLLLRLGLAAWRLRRLEASLRPGECAALDDAARELGLKQAPRLLIGPADAVPMVWGVFRPRLLLPEGFETWSAEKQRGVLLHELAHLRRGDPLALWAAQWVKVLHWCNPLAWLMLRLLRADQERACDDTVLRQGVRASDYAQSLLDLSRHNRLAPGLSLCALTITRCAPVESRVKAILDPARHREALTLRWVAAVAAGALLITLPVAMLHAIEGATLRGRLLDRHGLVLAESTNEKVRSYPYKTLAAHVLGYTGRSSQDDDTPIGRMALEQHQEAPLKEGKDIPLTLDMRVQALTTRAMAEGGLSKGAAVVLDPRTGEILAAVSLPSYDPNVFIPRLRHEDWSAYVSDKNLPLFNRCLAKTSSPANAFLPLTALAGIQAGVGDRTFECKVSTTSYQEKFQCLDVRQGRPAHGTIGMESALQCSCRHYWCQLGTSAGLDAFGRVGQWIGFGESYGITEGESEGILPTQEWWEKRRKGIAAWREEDTASLSEGMGFVQVTALQMSVLAATAANNGRVPQPTLLQRGAPAWRADLVKEGLSSVHIQKLREGMRLAVNAEGGVGQGARSEKAVIAGSTGVFRLASRDSSGQLKQKMHEWFIGFAPFENPVLAFAIFQEEASGQGSDTGPVVKRIVEETLALPADGSGEVKPVEDEIGRAHEVLLQVQARFDAGSKELKREIGEISKALGEGVQLKDVTIVRGKVTISGEAADRVKALGVLNRLPQIGKQWVIEWNFPLPTPLPESNRVTFRAEGLCTGAAEKDGTAQQKGKVTSAMDADIIMDPQLADHWRLLKRKGLLADLPVKAVISPLESSRTTPVVFQFSLSREDAQLWLTRSLGDALRREFEKQQPWPEKPGAFDYTYETLNGCMVHLKTLDPATVQVRVWIRDRQPKRILIAPDEAAPPTLKAAERKELPGVVTTSSTGNAAVELRVDEISHQISRLVKETGISLRAFKMGRGKVSFSVESDDADKVRLFRDRLVDSAGSWQIEWHTTGLQITKDRKAATFMAWGTDKTEVTGELTSQAAQPDAPASPDLLILPPVENWEKLRRFGKLASLPAGWTPDKVRPSPLISGPVSSMSFAFAASRKAVHEWLSASLPSTRLNNYAEPLRELAGTQLFQHEFWCRDGCQVQVKCVEDKARVLILRINSGFKIAPDEFQEPQPKGKLAPDYHQDGLAWVQPNAPTLDAGLQTLRSTIPPAEEKPVSAAVFFSSPTQFNLQVPAPPVPMVPPVPQALRHLASGLSIESEKVLLRSARANNRIQQGLIVKSSD